MDAREDAVDTLDEARDIAAARSAVYQQSLRNYHSRRLCPRSFVEGDLVLRLKQERPKKPESPWEGPYIVTKVIPSGAYGPHGRQVRSRILQTMERRTT